MTTTTKTFAITNTTSGLFLGVFAGATREEALDAMARAAGYASHEAACDAGRRLDEALRLHSDGSDLSVDEVTEVFKTAKLVSADPTISVPNEVRIYKHGAIACHTDGDVAYDSLTDLEAEYQIEVA